MENITVKKEELITTLRQNREEHRAMFLRAQEAYREKWAELLETRLRELRNGNKIDRYFRLPEPEDHTADFDTAIQMLEWEQNDTVELGFHDFRQYVQNEWGWQQSFAANTQSYLVE